MIKLVTGLILSVAVLSPLLRGNIITAHGMYQNVINASEYAVEEGKYLGEEMRRQYITERTETYILNKAKELGAEITVQVSIADQEVLIPEKVVIQGTVMPYVKKRLSSCIQTDLGIAEEHQIWIS